MNATLRILGQRLLQALPVIVLASFIVFGLMELVPGDIAVTLAGENATQEHIAALRQLYRLDDPFFLRYGLWLWRGTCPIAVDGPMDRQAGVGYRSYAGISPAAVRFPQVEC